MHNVEQGILSSDTKNTLGRSKHPDAYRDLEHCKETGKLKFFVLDLFLFATVQWLGQTPAILLLQKLFSKRGESHVWKWLKMGRQLTCIIDKSVLLVVSRLSSYSSSILSSTSRSKDQSNCSRKLPPTRNNKHACGKPILTDHCMQATEHHAPAIGMNKEDPSMVFSFGDILSQFISWTWRDVLAHASETVNSDSEGDAWKVESSKRKHSVHEWLDNSRSQVSTKDVNLGKNHGYAVLVQVLASHWNPCQTKNSQKM